MGSGVDEQYFYDADGQRVKKIDNGVATFYPSGLVEQTGGVVTKYYYFGGQRVAMRKDGVLTYLHGDHLGSTVLETDVSGNTVGDERFLAFGKHRSGAGVGTDHGFTGQKLDGSGLQYFNARYFDPQLGIFISPDTIVPDPTTAMDFNRYMFVRGNPLKFTDPSGHACMFVNERIECNTNPVIGGLTVSIDPNSTENHQPACTGSWCDDPYAAGKFLGGLTLGALLVTAAPAAIPAAIQAACRNDGDCTNEVSAATTPVQSVWNLRPFDRGVAIENMLGRSPFLVQNFPTIDRWQNGIATSIKSIDLGAKTYQNLTKLQSTIEGYVNTLANWQGANWGGYQIQAQQIQGREVLLAIPPNASAAQMQVLQQLQQWANTMGVTLNITTIQ